MIDNPCLGCAYVGCGIRHATCKDYQEYVKDRKDIYSKRKISRIARDRPDIKDYKTRMRYFTK